MGWDEWEQLKVAAAERYAAGTADSAMQLNRVPSESGGSGTGGQAGDGFRLRHQSLDGSSHLLIELAGLLYQGRPDGELCTTARAPRSHSTVAEKVDRFARFADDQYQDLTSLLAALSTRLRDAKSNYVSYDGEIAGGMMNALLETGVYVPPEKR
ncbi:hypothetical protein ACPCTN_10495 [Streptomyces cinereoruber]|uniref:hypothetical protein n=1 Tax=Streptomyces TaxID=1883 RepID=UPI001F38388F|nr:MULTISPECIES: hypothetical protein [unclassified Streptomyces]